MSERSQRKTGTTTITLPSGSREEHCISPASRRDIINLLRSISHKTDEAIGASIATATMRGNEV